MKTKTGFKAGKLSANHTRTALTVRAGLKAGKLGLNHSRSGLKVAAGSRPASSPPITAARSCSASAARPGGCRRDRVSCAAA